MQKQFELADCHARKEPGEEHFTLLARDRTSPALVRLWAAIRSGNSPEAAAQFQKLISLSAEYYAQNPTEPEQIERALAKADAMQGYKKR